MTTPEVGAPRKSLSVEMAGAGSVGSGLWNRPGQARGNKLACDLPLIFLYIGGHRSYGLPNKVFPGKCFFGKMSGAGSRV